MDILALVGSLREGHSSTWALLLVQAIFVRGLLSSIHDSYSLPRTSFMFGKMRSFALIFLFLGVSTVCQSARVLILSPVGSKSHKFTLMPIARALVERGHAVTLVTSHEPTEKIEGLKEITAKNIFDEKDSGNSVNWFQMTDIGSLKTIWKFAGYFASFTDSSLRVYGDLMSKEEFQKIVSNRDVDLVILDDSFNDFCLPIIDHLGVPFVYHSSTSGQPWTWNAMGVSADSAFIPIRFTPFSERMSFIERVVNTIQGFILQEMRKWIMIPGIQNYTKGDFPNGRPLLDVEKEASIFFPSIHCTTYWARPLPPNVIPIGAPHVRPPAPLPEDLRHIADNSGDDGFILFSLGSFQSSQYMPSKYLNTFINVFGSLKQKVIWKWDSQLPDVPVPNNVYMTKWLPQQDLLGHKNIRMFITHGGLKSMQEAIYHQVPILTLPFASDQHANIAKAAHEGFGVKLEWQDLDDQSLSKAIHTILSDPSFKANATRASRLMKDELMSAKDIAVYWLEHVLRHGNTNHLRPRSKDLPFHQIYLLDVIAFLVIVFLLFIYIAFIALRLLKRLLGRKLKRD